MVVAVLQPAVLLLRGVKSSQVGQHMLLVVRAMIIAGQWSVPAVARQSWQHESDKQS
jgi:hypothetical protein